MLLIGVFCAFRSRWFVATFPVLTLIYGLVSLFTGPVGPVDCGYASPKEKEMVPALDQRRSLRCLRHCDHYKPFQYSSRSLDIHWNQPGRGSGI